MRTKRFFNFFNNKNRWLTFLIMGCVASLIVGLTGKQTDKTNVTLIVLGAVGGVPALFEVSDRVLKTLEDIESRLKEVNEVRELKKKLEEEIASFNAKTVEIENERKAIVFEIERLRGIVYNNTSDIQSAKNEAQAAREVALRAESKLILELVERIVKLEKQ